MNTQPSILYIEDSERMHEELANAMGICLNADVTSCYENYDAYAFFKNGYRFDIYILDDHTPDSRGGSGTRLAVTIAEQIQKEGGSGIVIAACASNLAILGLGKGDFVKEEEIPLKLKDLHDNKVEFWFKQTERRKMLGWVAACLQKGEVIPRAEWLVSIGEDPRYDTSGNGNEVERKFFEYFDELTEEDRGVFLYTDFPALCKQLREGAYIRESLELCRLPDARPGEKEH